MEKEKNVQKNSLDALMEDFEKSGLSIDEFCKKYLSECGIKNPEEKLKKIDETFGKIEKHYSAIQKTRKQGGTRAQYLFQTCDPALSSTSPDNAGKILTAIIQTIVGKKDDPTFGVQYTDDESKEDAMKSIEEALKATAIKDSQDKEIEEEN